MPTRREIDAVFAEFDTIHDYPATAMNVALAAALMDARKERDALRVTVGRVRAYLDKRNYGMLNSAYPINVLVPTSEILAVLDTP